MVSREGGARSKGYVEGWTWKQVGIGGSGQSLRRGRGSLEEDGCGQRHSEWDLGNHRLVMLSKISMWSMEEAVSCASLKFRREGLAWRYTFENRQLVDKAEPESEYKQSLKDSVLLKAKATVAVETLK